MDNLYQKMLDTLSEGIYFVDLERQITFWNKGAEKITGFSSEAVLGSHCYDNILNHVDEQGKRLCFEGCPLHETIQDGQERENRVYLQHRLGHRVPVQVKVIPMYDEVGKRVGAVELFVDESHVFGKDLSEEELKAIAFSDVLTGIPNRRALEGQLKQHHQNYITSGIPYTVALIDIDFFKRVNDTYGHHIGDLTLQMVARTLAHATRSIDYAGRWGGEEFLMIFPGLMPQHALKVLDKVRRLVAASMLRSEDEYLGEAQDLAVTISIGAVTSGPEATIQDLLSMADQRLYQAKASGRNTVVCDTLES